MSEIKKINLTKKDISKKINSKTGLPNLYTNKIIDDFIDILKNLIKNKETNIKNFATFRIINKGDRIGRNPKTGDSVSLPGKNAAHFKPGKVLRSKINNLHDTD